MNYEQNVKYSFSDIPVANRGEALLLFTDSDYISVPTFQTDIENELSSVPSYDELLMYASSLGRLQKPNARLLGLMYHPYYVDTWDAAALFTASSIDFVNIKTDFNSLDIYNCDMYDAFETAFVVRSEPAVYPDFNYNEGYTSFTYSKYSQTVRSGEIVTFDYSVLKNNFYSGTDYHELHNRDNQIAYNYTYLSLVSNYFGDGLYLDFGSPIHDLYEEGRAAGYRDGYTNGYITGKNDGFIIGQNSQGLEQVNATPFTFIGSAFNSVGNLLSIEVLPNVSLGLCFSIPLVFTLIITMFKLVRK